MKHCLLTFLAVFLVTGTASAQIAKMISDGSLGHYEAFPDVVKLKNGDLLVAYYAGYGHVSLPREGKKDGVIGLIRSSDNGRTWSKPEILTDRPGDDRDPSLFQTSKGTVICNFMTHYGREKVPVAFNVFVTRSFDDGKTWEEPFEVPTPFKKVGVTTSPVIEGKDGSLLMPVYGRENENARAVDKDGQRDRSAILRSVDDGKTWNFLSFVDENPSKHQQESSIVELPDGRICCMTRPRGGVAYSSDGGKTWTPTEYLDDAVDCPYLFNTDVGLLGCGLRHRGNAPSITLMFSKDAGKTWEKPLLMADGAGAYPSIQRLDEKTFLYVYYRDQPGPSRIYQIYFRINQDGTVTRLHKEQWL